MSVLMKRFGLDGLSPEDRLELVEELLASVATPGGTFLTDSHKADLRRRLDAFKDNPKAGSPWEEVRESLNCESTLLSRHCPCLGTTSNS